MQPVSPSIDERSRKNLSLILRTLAEVTQVKVAERMCVSESTISRMNEDYFRRIAELVAAMDLKLVPADLEMWDEGYVENLRKVLAAELVLGRKPNIPFG